MLSAPDEDVMSMDKAPASAQKLTEWAKEPLITDVKGDLEAAKPFHDDQVMKINKWNDLHGVKGKEAIKKMKGRSQVQPKLIRRQAEWRYSALTEPFNSSEDLFEISATTHEDVKAAEQNQIVINWQFRTKLNKVNFIDNYVRAATDEGSVVVRVGWCRYTIKVKQMVPVWTYYQIQTQEEMQQLDQAMQAYNSDPRTFMDQAPPELQEAIKYFTENNVPVTVVKTGEEEVEVDKVIDNRPTLEVMNPQNVWLDPSSNGDFDKSSFVGISFETSQAELKKEPQRYKNLDAVNWETSTVITDTEHASQLPQTFNFKDLLRKRVVAYEWWGNWDINGDGILVPIVVTWIGDVIIRMEENPYPDKKPPFVLANYNPVKRELQGEPDAELLEDNQKVLGAVTRGIIDLLGRSANSQQGFAKGMLDVVNRRRYEAGQDYEFNPNMKPQDYITNHTYPEIPNSALTLLGIQNQEAEALTGVKSFSGGMSGEAYGDVAAGIRGVLDAAAKREMAILRRLAQGIIDIGRKIIAMNQVFLSEEETIRVTNDEFVKIKREELAGEFDLKVAISTAEIDNMQAQDLAFMLQTMGNNMDFGITKLILVKIAKLKRMPDLAHAIEQFTPQPDPLTQRKLEAEVAKLEEEVKKLRAATQLDGAKTEKTMAEADLIDLDKTEQETGTKHERELEQQRAQATGNQDLEVTKALLKPKKNADGSESKPDIESAIGYKSIQPRLNQNQTGRPDLPVLTNRDMARPVNSSAVQNIGSKSFDPRKDPALNPAMNF